MTLTPPELPSTEGSPLRSQPAAGKTTVPSPQTFDVADALVGRSLGHFRIETRLGSGAMAAVYRATDLILDRQVALKVLLPGADDVVRERFRQEARTVSVLDHPNIVRTLQVGQTDGVTYIAMDLVEGSNLADLLGERGRLSVSESCHLLEPVARALAYAHRQHVVHRDVKPSNILLRRLPADAPQGLRLSLLDYPLMPLLSDFGIALALDSPELTAAGRTVGTPTYMAPEQAADSHEIDGRADIYALGIVLYRCLVGRPPFVGSTTQILHAHVYEPLTIPAEAAAELPPLVVEVLQRMLAKEPADRYPDAALLADDLALASGSQDPSATLHNEPTATMPALPSPTSSVAVERVQVLVPAPGSRTAAPRVAPAPRPAQPAPEPAVRLHPPGTRSKRSQRNAAALIFGSLAALLLIGLGAVFVGAVLPLDRLLARIFAPGQPTAPAISGPATPTLVATAPPTPIPNLLTAAATPAPGQTSAATETRNPEPTPATPTANPLPTLEVDVELYWEVVVDDYNLRDWNKTLGNLILILRSESVAFQQALLQGQATPAQLVRSLLLEDRATGIWSEWGELFDPARIEAMLFEIYVGLGTEENAAGQPKPALDHFNDALAIRPSADAVVALRNATEQFLEADEARRESARQTLGEAHLAFALELAAAAQACGAAEQLAAATSLLRQPVTDTALLTVRQECDSQLTVIAGQRLRKELTGTLIYSTQEGESFRIYRQPLEPEATPQLLVNDARQPRLSADGRSLAFYRTGSGSGIGGLRLDAQANILGVNNLTTNGNDAKDSPPSWSPEGGRLAFASVRQADERVRIYIKPSNEDNSARELTLGQDPAWRPLGDSWIAYSGRAPDGATPTGLWLVTDDGLRWQNLTIFERDRRPTWTPDAQQLVFMSDGRDGNWEIYRLTVSRTYQVQELVRLTESLAQDGLPTVSPDGKYVAYASDEGGRWRIWVTPLDQSGRPAPVLEIRGSLTNWLEHAIQWLAN